MSTLAQPTRAWPRLTIFLLVFGWVIFGVGAIVGLALLWSSDIWTRRDRVLGTLIPISEGGFLVALWLMGSTTSSSMTSSGTSSFGIQQVLGIILALVLFAVIVASVRQLLRRLH